MKKRAIMTGIAVVLMFCMTGCGTLTHRIKFPMFGDAISDIKDAGKDIAEGVGEAVKDIADDVKLDDLNLGTISMFQYDNADKYLAGDGEVNADVSKLVINWVSGNVTVKDGNDGSISFSEKCSKDHSDDYTMRYLVDDDTLYIQYAKAGSLEKIENLRKDLTIEIPKGYEFKEVKVDTVSADVTMKNDIAAEEFYVGTVSGACKTNKTLASADIKAETVSGDISLNVEGAENIDCGSVSGNIGLTIPKDTGFSGEFSTVSGSFHTNFDTDGNDRVFSYGDGKLSIAVSTVSGSLSINK